MPSLATRSSSQWNPLALAGLDPSHRALIYQPPNTGIGNVFRPESTQEEGGFGATLETLFDFWLDAVYDPDEALVNDPTFTQKLRMQPDVASCFNRRQLSVSRMPWHVEKNDDKRADPQLAQEVADYCQYWIGKIPDLRVMFNMMEEGVLWGGQGINLNWVRTEGVVAPVRWMPVSKTRFQFDREGRMSLLTREQPVWGRLIANSQVLPTGERAYAGIPAGVYLYHVWDVGQGTWSLPNLQGYWYFGRGLDVPLSMVVRFDAFVLRVRMKYFEKHGMPLTKLYHPDNVDPGQLMSVARSIRGEGVVRLPRPVGQDKEYLWAVEFVPPPTSTNDILGSFYSSWTQPAIEKILVSGGEVMDISAGGSYAGSVSQHDQGPTVIYEYDAQRIGSTLSTQLVPPLVHNRRGWENLPDYLLPKLVMQAKEEKDRTKEMEVCAKAATMVPVAKKQIYELSGLREPAPDEETVFLGGPQAGFEDVMGQVDGLTAAMQPKPGGGASEGEPVKPLGGADAAGVADKPSEGGQHFASPFGEAMKDEPDAAA